jgi:hypothetical protein
MKQFVVYKSNGSMWKAGTTIIGLCSAYNHATDPSLYLSDTDHKRSYTYARAIKARMRRIGFVHGTHYVEMSNGALWPLKTLA